MTIYDFNGACSMEIRNLLTFTYVAEQGSFTKAAELLGYSQSTVSFQIKQLEEELDCLLFERINHTIALTERGRELVSYAHKILALTDEFKEKPNKAENLTGLIHIVTPDSVCEDLVIPIILRSTISTPALPFVLQRQIPTLCLTCWTTMMRM